MDRSRAPIPLTSTLKRSFDDLSPDEVAEQPVAGSSSARRLSPIPCAGSNGADRERDRHKRARSGSGSDSSEVDDLLAASGSSQSPRSSGQSSFHTTVSAAGPSTSSATMSMGPMAFHPPLSSPHAPLRFDDEDIDMDMDIDVILPFIPRSYAVESTSSLPAPQPDANERFQRTLERINTFDREISVLRESHSPLPGPSFPPSSRNGPEPREPETRPMRLSSGFHAPSSAARLMTPAMVLAGMAEPEAHDSSSEESTTGSPGPPPLGMTFRPAMPSSQPGEPSLATQRRYFNRIHRERREDNNDPRWFDDGTRPTPRVISSWERSEGEELFGSRVNSTTHRVDWQSSDSPSPPPSARRGRELPPPDALFEGFSVPPGASGMQLEGAGSTSRSPHRWTSSRRDLSPRAPTPGRPDIQG